MKSYSSKSNAKRAAAKELGQYAAEGLDYRVVQHRGDGKWFWETKGPTEPPVEAETETPPIVIASSEPSDCVAPPPSPATGNGETVIAGETSHKPRRESKEATVISMLERPEGAKLADIMERMGWQAHTVRGMISGALKKKRGLEVLSERNATGDRVYRIPS